MKQMHISCLVKNRPAIPAGGNRAVRLAQRRATISRRRRTLISNMSENASTMNLRQLLAIPALLALLALCACGGGNGGGDNSPPSSSSAGVWNQMNWNEKNWQ
jgi:hypothetical protein